MNDVLFDTKEKKEVAIGRFRGLLVDPGWELLVKVIDANIEIIKKQIIDGTEDETKESIERLRDKLKVHENVKNTPKTFIEQFTGVEADEPKVDPFQTVKEFQDEQKKRG